MIIDWLLALHIMLPLVTLFLAVPVALANRRDSRRLARLAAEVA